MDQRHRAGLEMVWVGFLLPSPVLLVPLENSFATAAMVSLIKLGSLIVVALLAAAVRSLPSTAMSEVLLVSQPHPVF
jgi:hypothetical protein